LLAGWLAGWLDENLGVPRDQLLITVPGLPGPPRGLYGPPTAEVFMIAKAFTPFLRVKAFVIMAEIQVEAIFSTSFRYHEGFATLLGIKSFAIMAGTSAGCGWGWRG
jgi:hypothetical protein